MNIEIEHLAKLARIALTDHEKTIFSNQLSAILMYINKLNELDTSNVEPTSHVLELKNITRKDIPVESLKREEALANAPDHTERFYRVPKIIE